MSRTRPQEMSPRARDRKLDSRSWGPLGFSFYSWTATLRAKRKGRRLVFAPLKRHIAAWSILLGACVAFLGIDFLPGRITENVGLVEVSFCLAAVIVLALVAGWANWKRPRRMTFDAVRRLCWKGTGFRTPIAKGPLRNNVISFDEIRSVQVIRSRIGRPRLSPVLGRIQDHGHELNLVLHNGRRVNVSFRWTEDEMVRDAKLLADFLGVEAWFSPACSSEQCRRAKRQTRPKWSLW